MAKETIEAWIVKKNDIHYFKSKNSKGKFKYIPLKHITKIEPETIETGLMIGVGKEFFKQEIMEASAKNLTGKKPKTKK